MEQHRIIGTTRRTILAGIAVTLARGSQAQQRDGMRRLGVLMGEPASDSEGQANVAALLQGLRALGWTEGGNLRIEWRRAGGDPALFGRYAEELVALGPEVLLAASSASVLALRRQQSTIPIVFVGVTDPIGQGFADNLARPGGNITGFSAFDPPMAGKWLEMLTRINPRVARIAVMFDPATTPYAGLVLHAIEEAAPSLTVVVVPAPVNDYAEIEAMMAGLAREERGGLWFCVAHSPSCVATRLLPSPPNTACPLFIVSPSLPQTAG